MPDHTGRGFWCEFCKDYHGTIECPHPAIDGESPEALREEIAWLRDANDTLCEKGGLLDDLLTELEALVDENSGATTTAYTPIMTGIKRIVEKYNGLA